MVYTRLLFSLSLACLTLQPIQCYNQLNSIKSVGMGAAFGMILPTGIGVGVHILENKLHPWSQDDEDEAIRTESNKIFQTTCSTTLSLAAWTVMNGLAPDDVRMSLAMMSIYCYAQGRAFFMTRQSKLKNAACTLLPASISLLAYNRISGLAPQMDSAGKSLLVFLFATACGL